MVAFVVEFGGRLVSLGGGFMMFGGLGVCCYGHWTLHGVVVMKGGSPERGNPRPPITRYSHAEGAYAAFPWISKHFQ